MGTINKVLLIGRLGKDPEERTTAGGTRVAQFNLATDAYRGANNEKNTEWHRIVCFGKTAELCNQYLKKGQLVCVEGALQTRSWEKNPGDKHYITEIVASRITFLGAKNSTSATAETEEIPF
jgi:single-strand DNA-binding protein